MQKIKKKYSFLARRPMENNSNRLYHSENVLYCQHCRQMSRMRDFYVLKNGKDQIEELEKHMDTECLSSFSDVIDRIAQNNYPTACILPTKLKQNELQEIYDSIEFEMHSKNKPKLVCPKCGKEILFRNIKGLTRSSSWKHTNTYVHAFEIKEDGENKFILSIFIFSIFPVVNVGKLKYIETNVRFVFNKKTKNVFMLQPINTMTMKPAFRNDGNDNGIKRILNITYMSNVSNFITYFGNIAITEPCVLNYLADYICSLYKTDKKDVLTERYTFRDIVYYFRYYNTEKETRKIIKSICSVTHLQKASMQRRKLLLQDIYKMQQSPEELLKVMERKKCPDKKRLRKMAIKNPFVVYAYRFLTKMGMKDYNVILNVIEEYNSRIVFFIQVYTGLTYEKMESEQIKKFVHDFIKNKGDIQSKKLLFDKIRNDYDYEHILHDCARLYHTIITESDNDERCFVEFCDIYKMHDDMARIIPKLKTKNKKIPYHVKDFSLCSTIGEYSFILPPDTFSLIDCGEKMGICVGGYGDSALNKSCIIVFMMKDNKYAGCIEITSDKKTLKQAKSKFNGLINGDAALALKKWVEHNGISTEKCHDYRHISEGNMELIEYQYGYRNFAANPVDDVDKINKNIEISSDYLVVNRNGSRIDNINIAEIIHNETAGIIQETENVPEEYIDDIYMEEEWRYLEANEA